MQIRWRPKLAEAGQVQLGDKSFIRLGGGRSLGLTVTRCWVRGKQSEDKKKGNRLKSREVQTRHSVGVQQRWTKCSAVLRLQDHVVLRSWKLRTWASPTSLSWNRDPGVISKPRSNSSSSNLLETSSPFIIVFFSILAKLWCLCISPEISIGSIFLLNLSASGKSSQLAAGRSNSQHLHLICPKILFAQKDYLPRIIICPKILFAQKYYLSRKNFCSEIFLVQKHFLLSNIICSEISFAQKYYLLRNDISSDIIFVQKYFYFSAKYLIWIFCPSSKYLLVLAGILVIHLSPSLEKYLNF